MIFDGSVYIGFKEIVRDLIAMFEQDARGKIVLVLRYEPPPRDEKSPFQTAPRYSSHAALYTKAANARDHGAIGMILVDLNHTGDEKNELLTTQRSLWRSNASVVAAQVKRRVIDQWLKPRGISLDP